MPDDSRRRASCEHEAFCVHGCHRRRAHDRFDQPSEVGARRRDFDGDRALSRRPWELPHRHHHPPAVLQLLADRRGFALEWRTKSQQAIESGLRHHQTVRIALDQLAQARLDVAADGNGLDGSRAPRQQRRQTSPSNQPRRGDDERIRSDSGCASMDACLIRTTSRASARGSAPAICDPAGMSIGRSLNECTTMSASPATSAWERSAVKAPLSGSFQSGEV